MDRIGIVLRDDSGFILRGGWALAFLAFMFIMAVLGQVSWEGFGLTLLASMVLTGLGALFSGSSRSEYVPAAHTSHPPHGGSPSPATAAIGHVVAAQAQCIGCGVWWDLDEAEASMPSFTCPECGTLMDSGRFSEIVAAGDAPVAAQVQCIGCGVWWDLDEAEASMPSFTCPECGTLMDSGRFAPT